MREKLGIVVVGCGLIAPRHLDALREVDAFRLVACVDILEERAKTLAVKYEAEHYYTSIDEALETRDVDAVDICLPHHLHEKVAVDAANRGKHVLVEKPLARSLKEADEMISAAQDNGVVLMVEQTQRFRRCNVKAKELLKEGRIGEIRNVLGRRIGSRRTFHADWGRSPELSGGELVYGVGTHEVDLVLWLLDTYAVRVYAEGVRNNPYWNDFDEVSAQMRFANGAMYSINLSVNTYWLYDIIMIGMDGSMMLEGKNIAERLKLGRTEDERGRFFADEVIVEAELIPDEVTMPYTAAIREFADAIIERREPEASGRDVRRTIWALDAIRLSMETHSPISIGDI